MIYPIVAYGDPVLRQKAVSLEQGANMEKLVAAMFATMDQADGVGLAAPQIGQSIRLFVVNLSPFMQAHQESADHRKVYINPTLRWDDTEELQYHEEGCLSIPEVMINVPRQKRLIVDYFNINWEQQQEVLEDMAARVIKHEYDHLEGKLHIDYAEPFVRKLLNDRLNNISKGKIKVRYPMRFPNMKMAKMLHSH